MKRSRLVALCLALIVGPTWADPAWAAELIADTRQAEARARFNRARVLIDERDNPGALAELQRAYQLVPNRLALLAIGMTYAEMGRPVEAVRTLDRVLADGGELSPEKLGLARSTRTAQAGRIGYLRINTSVPAVIQVDGVDIGRTPLAEPIAVPIGARLVSAVSAGHLPARREATVASGATVEVDLPLEPSQRRLAHVYVRTALPDAEVLVDGERVARTPLPGSLTVASGTRTVELRRRGYAIGVQQVNLGEEATAELMFPATEAADPTVPRGTLSLRPSEPEVELEVDGTPRGVYRAPLSLVAGRHTLRVVRAGFIPVERMVDVPDSGQADVRVTLAPTPETRASYVASARSTRRWGWIGSVGGGALAAAAVGFVALNAGPLGDARTDRDRILASYEAGGECQPAAPRRNPFECDADLAAANDDVDGRVLRRNLGLAAAGVGAAVALIGAYLLLTGDDPARYDDVVHEPTLPRFGVQAAVDPRGGAALLLSGRF